MSYWLFEELILLFEPFYLLLRQVLYRSSLDGKHYAIKVLFFCLDAETFMFWVKSLATAKESL